MKRTMNEIMRTLENQAELIKKHLVDLDSDTVQLDDNSLIVDDYSIEGVDSIDFEGGNLTTDGELIIHSFTIEKEEGLGGLYLVEKQGYCDIVEAFENCRRVIGDIVDNLRETQQLVLNSEYDLRDSKEGNYALTSEEAGLAKQVILLTRADKKPIVLTERRYVALSTAGIEHKATLKALEDIVSNNAS